jgi:DNA-directed RNA polymerase specialized sigma24 family protein
MSPPGLRRYRAERLLRSEFAGLRSKVLAIVRSQLRAKGVALDPADLEGCYAQAWHGLYATVLDGEEVENPKAWLVLVTFRRALDESSAARLEAGGEARAPALHLDLARERLRAVSDPDLAGELDNRASLRQVFEGLRARLSARECEAASLCYLQGLTRAEAAERMGIAEARMRKLMEGAPGRPGVAGKVAELLGTIKAGGWCEQQSSLMRALAFGMLDPEGERHALAMAHCRQCPACRAHVASLRGIAAVLPLPLLSPLVLAGAGAAGTATSATGAGSAGAGTTAAAVVAGAGMRVGSGVTGSGWSGLAGSLTAKLAVTAAVMLGTGYVVLGSRAHGSPPTPRAATAPQAAANETLSRALAPALGSPAHGRRLTRRSSTTHMRSSRTAHSPGETAGPEFGPERIRREATAAPSAPVAAPAPSPRNSSRAAREFGIE